MKPDFQVAGMIAFVFACYGAGYPKTNDYWRLDGLTSSAPIGSAASVSSLAKTLLAHPNGGALAVMGHIERAMDTSFTDNGTTPSTGCFESAIRELMSGKPIGMASE